MAAPQSIARRFPSVGRCIYCPATEGLTDEHILPVSLGGLWILPEASCSKCQVPTQKFEERVARNMYWPLRLRLGIQGSRKRKNKRPTHWPIEITNHDGSIEIAPVEVGKVPTAYLVPTFPPPSYRTGVQPARHNPKFDLSFKINNAELQDFAREISAGRSEISLHFEWAPFAKLIAKVGHAYAIALLGMDGIQFFLPKFIVGDHSFISEFIGCADADQQLPHDSNLALSLVDVRGETLVVAHVTFFGPNRFPTYEAIVGLVTDPELIARKMAVAMQR